ncbi:phosphate signaling complex protein PhoU [Vallitalea guaymasensis]|uniref:Phosphate-specific transport system accessory protein PhoU n=1 Tax=Vallitalea guaymasensis TaxID=1185412 RepID=A0A8J8SAP5_9FIRM|nr:phosphate signaling complex protein PhoU [Vallitalea guaymasensis]QUH27580.1 phosphate signaling complex protein PhoU [Vallitalea guaymasensis]
MPIRYNFEKKINELHKDLIKMGTLIEQSLDDAITALKKQDVSLAKKVISKDDEIDYMELRIEKECLLLIATQQPIAADLRDIASVLKIITDLERIGDHCTDISEYTIRLADEKYIKPLIHIPQMAEEVKKMIKDTIDSCINKDLELAKSVCKRDDIIDNYFDKIVNELMFLMIDNSSVVKQCTDFLFIVKYLERMGDHATNIAEWIIFTVTGEHI